MTSSKPVRTLDIVKNELSQRAHEAGIYEFQMQREIPEMLEKIYNSMTDLNREAQKLYRESQISAAATQPAPDLAVVEPVEIQEEMAIAP